MRSPGSTTGRCQTPPGGDGGEFLDLVGPAGYEKSTTLGLISRLEVPTVGRIHLGERDVTDVPPEERNVAVVFAPT